MFSKPFYTPIFDRAWVERIKQEAEEEKRKKEELQYSKNTDDEYEEESSVERED